MEIVISQEQGRVPITILSVKGEINAETSDEFLAAARQVHMGGARDLLLDLSEVGYISSWGIRALSDVYSLVRDQGGSGVSKHLKLLCPTPQVRKVLETAGLDLYIESFTDRKQAVASF